MPNPLVKFNYSPRHCRYYSLVFGGNVVELCVFDTVDDMIVHTIKCIDKKTDLLIDALNGTADAFKMGLNDILINDEDYSVFVGYKDMRTTPKPSIFTLGVGMSCLTSQT